MVDVSFRDVITSTNNESPDTTSLGVERSQRHDRVLER